MLNKPFLFLFLLLNFLVSCNVFRVEQATPSVREVSLVTISALGGDSIVLKGENLREVEEVKLNGVRCLTLTKISSSELECETPSHGGVPSEVVLTIHYRNKSVTLPHPLKYVLSFGGPAESNYIDKTLSTPMVVRSLGGKFFLVDYGNHRVLVWNAPPTSFHDTPDLIIGQPGVSTRPFQGLITPKRETLLNPTGVWTDGVKLAVADMGHHRVLLWNSFPTTHGAPADVVLGQPDFESKVSNNGPATPECGALGRNACSMSSPYDVTFAEDKLFVTDKTNNRVLVWEGWPTQNQKPADHILGQPSATAFAANAGPNTPACGGASGRNACSFSSPGGIFYHGGKLFIADTSSHRVLIFNTLPLSYGSPADIVLGQPTVLAGTPNNGTRSASTMSGPNFVVSDGTRIFVSDGGNHRVLGWSSFPVATGEAATIVLGQDDFMSGMVNKGSTLASASSLSQPRGVALLGADLWVVDSANHRLLEFSNPVSFASATKVWGHTDMFYNEVNAFGTFFDSLQSPTSVRRDSDYTFIVDRLNHRVIIESVFPFVMNNTSNRIVLGQPDHFQGRPNNGPATPECGGVAGVNRCSLYHPLDVMRVDGKLVVTDFSNKRVLIWNSIPVQNQGPADVVIGQPDFVTTTTSNGPNTPACGGVSGVNKCSISQPVGLASDGTNLVITDQAINRILIWNTIPLANHAPADVVLGQPDFFTSLANNGPATADCDNIAGLNRCSLSKPYMAVVHESKLIVSDYDNNRVLIWNSMPTFNQEPADVVIGQTDFVTNAQASASFNSFTRPIGVCVGDNGKLAVADSENHRVLIFPSVPVANNTSATEIIGQRNWTSNVRDGGEATGLGGMNRPFGLGCYQNGVLISDYYNSRILYYPL